MTDEKNVQDGQGVPVKGSCCGCSSEEENADSDQKNTEKQLKGVEHIGLTPFSYRFCFE